MVVEKEREEEEDGGGRSCKKRWWPELVVGALDEDGTGDDGWRRRSSQI
jgi:hypothetical protein